MVDPDYASEIRSKILDNLTFQDYEHYGAIFSYVEDHGTGHVTVLAPNGDAISASSTINTSYDFIVWPNS